VRILIPAVYRVARTPVGKDPDRSPEGIALRRKRVSRDAIATVLADTGLLDNEQEAGADPTGSGKCAIPGRVPA